MGVWRGVYWLICIVEWDYEKEIMSLEVSYESLHEPKMIYDCSIYDMD